MTGKMDKITAAVAVAMIQENEGDRKRIEHSMKVFSYAQTMGVLEGLDPETQQILEITALLHDIGIHISEQKYSSSACSYQEFEGPLVAGDILRKMQLPSHVVERICYIISRHHTYSAIDGIDFQLLIEADFLVNSVEDQMTESQITSFSQKYFKSRSGKYLLKLLFPDYLIE